MQISDPIADMLTRIRNGIQARHDSVLIPNSLLKTHIARILKEEGFIRDYEQVKDARHPTLRVWLRYVGTRESVVTGLKRVSKPGLRVYTRRDSIPRVRGGLGTAIISTPQGVMSGRKAYQLGLGGEVVCYVW